MMKNNMQFYEYIADGLQLNFMFGKAPRIIEEDAKTTPNGFHTHFWYELFFAKSESLSFHTKEKEITVSPGHFLLVCPNYSHYVTKNDIVPVFSFAVTQSAKVKSHHPITEMLKYPDYIIFKGDEESETLFDLLCRAALKEKVREAGNNLFGFLLHLSDMKALAEENRVIDNEVLRVFKIDWLINEYVTNNIPFNLKSLAEELNISTRQLSRVFKNKYGCSYSEKITALKMDKAIRLLKSGKNINDVAYESGYLSIRGFYSSFYETFGVTPGEYKKQNGLTD